MSTLAKLILKCMISFVALNYPSAYPNTESQQVVLARYESIANDIAEGAENSVKSPTTTVFDNDNKGVKIGLLLAIIAATESNGYAASVDTCARGGDNHTAWTIFQLNEYYAPKYVVCHDRKQAVKYAIQFIKRSFEACHNLSFNSRLSIYDTGKCIEGEKISVRRMGNTVFHGMSGMAASGLEKTLKDFSAAIAVL